MRERDFQIGNHHRACHCLPCVPRTAGAEIRYKDKCSKCWARFYCSGGCAANAHAFNGDIAKPYEMECKLEQKRLECAMAIYAIEQENAQQEQGGQL